MAQIIKDRLPLSIDQLFAGLHNLMPEADPNLTEAWKWNTAAGCKLLIYG
jgi:hypothetical protein